MQCHCLAEFLEHLRTIPWFASLGQPIGDKGIRQIHRWDEWPGLEHPPVTKYFDRQQEWYDVTMGTGDPPPPLQAVWDQIHALVLRHASVTVPYDPEEGVWHGPTAAVLHAAYAACLLGVFLHLGRPMRDELVEEWRWFEKGHWPCGYAGLYVDEEPTALLIY